MYQKKGKQSALIRIFFGICLFVGIFWLVKNPNILTGRLKSFGVDGGSVLGTFFKNSVETAKEQAIKVGERVGGNFQFSIFNFQIKKREQDAQMVFKFAIVTDSHEDETSFPMVLEKIKDEGVDFLIHLGDLVNSGNLAGLKKAKDFLHNSGVPYFVIPGDHDYNWQLTHSLANFKQIFEIERIYTSFEHKGFFFILFDNSDNSEEVDVTQMSWLKKELEKTINNSTMEQFNKVFFFSHKPLFNPYFPDKVDPNGVEVLNLLSEYNVAQVFSGDVHTFARYPDSQTGIGITTVGAAGTYKNPLPQYALVTVYEDGSFEVEPKPLMLRWNEKYENR